MTQNKESLGIHHLQPPPNKQHYIFIFFTILLSCLFVKICFWGAYLSKCAYLLMALTVIDKPDPLFWGERWYVIRYHGEKYGQGLSEIYLVWPFYFCLVVSLVKLDEWCHISAHIFHANYNMLKHGWVQQLEYKTNGRKRRAKISEEDE